MPHRIFLFQSSPKDMFTDFREKWRGERDREGRREGERERGSHQLPPLLTPAAVQTRNLSVFGLHSNHLSHRPGPRVRVWGSSLPFHLRSYSWQPNVRGLGKSQKSHPLIKRAGITYKPALHTDEVLKCALPLENSIIRGCVG